MARHLLELHTTLRLSVSHTTRAPRPGELDGVAYHFIDRASFEGRIARRDFVEWAEYAGHLYGTSTREVDDAHRDGCDLLFDVDVVGAAALKARYSESVSVFILPPSMEVLGDRLRKRGTDDREVVLRRMGVARAELAVAHTFDHLIINDVLEDAVRELECVYLSCRSRASERRLWLQRFGVID